MILRTCFTLAPPHDAALECFTWADAVADLSFGDGFGETYGLRTLFRHSVGKLIALRLGKPLAVFPQTIGPFQTQIGRSLARYLLRRSHLICVREKTSEKIVQDLLGTDDKVTCLADMAFLMQETDISSSPHLLAELPDTSRSIGVNVSGFLWNRGHEIFAKCNATFDYQQMVVDLVRRLVQETGKPVVLIPHVFSENPGVCDLNACRAVQGRLGDLKNMVVSISRDYSAPEIKAIIGQCEFFVGSRMHSCIAALSTGTPLVPVSYSHKFAGILQRFGIQDWLADPKVLSQEQTVDLVLSGYEHRKEIRERIVTELPAVKSEAMRAGQLLKKVIN